MLDSRDYGIVMQILKKCDRIINKISNIDETKFSSDNDIIEVVCFNLF